MAFDRPTLEEIHQRIKSDIETRLEGADSKLRRSMIAIFSRAYAGAVHLAYGYIDWLKRQIFVDTADTVFLERHGSNWGIPRKAAVAAAGSAEATGVDGNIVTSGSILTRSDAVEFTVDSDATIAGGVATIDLTAVVEGSDGNVDAAAELTFQTPIAGIDSVVTVDSDGLIGGTDEEDDEDLRARVLARIQTTPMGGAEADYVKWATDNTGVTRAWENPEAMGPGTVGVSFMMDNKTGSDHYGDDLVTNGDFATDTDWTKGTGWTISANKADCDGSQVATSNLQQTSILRAGCQYKVTFTVSSYSAGTITPYCGVTAGTARSADGTYIEVIHCDTNGNLILAANTTFVGKVDDVSAEILLPITHPTAAEIAVVQTYIDAVRPLTATTYVTALKPRYINFTLSVTPNTAAVQAAVEAELTDLFYREGTPGETVYLTHLNESISAAAGETDHTLASPAADVSVLEDEILVLGDVTFT